MNQAWSIGTSRAIGSSEKKMTGAWRLMEMYRERAECRACFTRTLMAATAGYARNATASEVGSVKGDIATMMREMPCHT